MRVVAQWDDHRTDWLLGTTLRGPREARRYEIDGVAVNRIALPAAVRRQLTPWVLAYYAIQGPALARIARALAAEIGPHADGVDLIHNCRIGREGISFASLQVARARGVPLVLTPVHHPRWGGWLHRHFHRLYRQADAVIALTQAERETLEQLGVDSRRIFITGMGPILADQPDGANFRERHGLGAASMVLFLGQQYRYKGVAALLAAAPLIWRRRPEARLVFAGPRTDYSRRLFGTNADSRILELGALDLQSKTDALAACDVLCVPSSQESFGGVYVEAWSLGKPVVAAAIPAVRCVVDDGVDGFLVPQSPAEIANRLLQLLEQPALAAQMGERGRAKAAENYTWPRLAALTEQAYEWALHQSPG